MDDVQVQLTITAQPQNASLVRERVKEAAIRLGYRPPDLDDLEIAVGEAVTNAILYGCPSEASRVVVTVWVSHSDESLHVEVRDQGKGFDAGSIRTKCDHDALGGRGLRLMRALMDRVYLHYDGSGMSVRLSKRLPGPLTSV